MFLHNYFFIKEALADDDDEVFKPACFFPALTLADPAVEFLVEALSFFGEADKLPLPLVCALPDALILALLAFARAALFLADTKLDVFFR